MAFSLAAAHNAFGRANSVISVRSSLSLRCCLTNLRQHSALLFVLVNGLPQASLTKHGKTCLIPSTTKDSETSLWCLSRSHNVQKKSISRNQYLALNVFSTCFAMEFFFFYIYFVLPLYYYPGQNSMQRCLHDNGSEDSLDAKCQSWSLGNTGSFQGASTDLFQTRSESWKFKES